MWSRALFHSQSWSVDQSTEIHGSGRSRPHNHREVQSSSTNATCFKSPPSVIDDDATVVVIPGMSSREHFHARVARW